MIRPLKHWGCPMKFALNLYRNVRLLLLERRVARLERKLRARMASEG